MTNEHYEGIPEDLEDGEIETDDENTRQNLPDGNTHAQFTVNEKTHLHQNEFPKEKSKKKKSKNNKRDEKSKDKDKHRKHHHESPKEDFAENVERAIKRALKNEESDIRKEREKSNHDERKKGKKRKKEHKEKDSNKKRRKHSDEEVDESEMMFVRGASPTRQTPTPEVEPQPESCENSSYESDCSNDSRNIRDRQRRLKRKKNYPRRREPHPMQEADGICIYFMQGQCQDSDCPYSHDAEPPRKYELCKFYLMKCCAKGDNCLYMHSDFPCKYYHTGLPCSQKDECKFAHGKPLNDNIKSILLKHIETAPKEILGDFPRMTRESAAMMIKNAQIRLMQQYNMIPPPEKEHNIPSLFDLNVSKPAGFGDNQNKNFNKMPKSKQSRWQNEILQPNTQNIPITHNTGAPNVLSIKNLHGVLTPKQIVDLNNLGIENLSQLSQLTVIQLNSLGLNLKQIHDIQMNTMSIQKLGLIESEESQPASKTPAASKDLDLRVAPAMLPVTSAHVPATPDRGMDVDMRFQPAKATKNETKENYKSDPKSNKDTIDIDQYRKDALKFIRKDIKSDDEVGKEENINEIKDVDHRVLMPIDSEKNNSTYPIAENAFLQNSDTDIRFLAPDNTFSKKIDRKQRISTTDDEDNNLLIDEKWYSSDDEKCKEKDRNDTIETGSPDKKELQKKTPRGPSTPPPLPAAVEKETIFNKIGDLSKIDISDQVSKLLNSMKNNLHDEKESLTEKVADSKPRDPRSRKKVDSKPKDSVVVKSPMNDFSKDVHKSTATQKKSSKESIYSCVDGPTDSRRRTDVDLRLKNDQDFRLPTLGDTDLRQTPGEGDIDFRIALPFKPIANYTPATEINGSINSHLPIPYKVQIVYVPRPDYTDIKNTTAKSQALADPRLRKMFRLSTEETSSDSEKSTAKPVAVRADPRPDPRKKPKENPEILLEPIKPSNSLDLQVVIQNSPWYKDLSTNQKILVNQQLATITSQIKIYQQDSSPGKRFDSTFVTGNPILSSIFNNLGIILNEDGELLYTSDSMSQQHNFPPNQEMFNMENRMANMSMPPTHMPNMPLHQFNANFSNTGPRNAPGLLGIAPNMPFPERFNHPNGNFNGFGGMPFNNPVDMDNRHMGRGFHHGRGNDRWARGGRGGNRRNW